MPDTQKRRPSVSGMVLQPSMWNFENDYMHDHSVHVAGRFGMIMGTSPTVWSGVEAAGIFGRYISSTLRGVGQVIFMDNPFSGLLIVVGTVVDDHWSGLLALVAVSVSTIVSTLLLKDQDPVHHGLHGYNGHLVGCLVARLAQCADARMFGILLLPTIIFSIFSNVVFIALGNVCVRHFRVPPLTLPFNIVCTFWIASASMSPRFPGGPLPSAPVILGESMAPTYEAMDVLAAIPKGIGQVWLCDGLAAGVLMLAGVLACSPISAFNAVLGSVTGTLCAIAVGANPESLYAGIYGYNAVLGAVAVGGIFFRFNIASVVAATACGVMCTAVQFFIVAAVSPAGLGVMTLPFCIGTLPFLLLGGDLKYLRPVPLSEATTPEEVMYKDYKEKRRSFKEKQAQEYDPESAMEPANEEDEDTEDAPNTAEI